jgi:hypothetical protein
MPKISIYSKFEISKDVDRGEHMENGKHIYYLDSGYNISEFVRPENVVSTWSYQELQWAAAIDSNISVGSHLTDANDFKADDMRVYFLTRDWHVHELAYSSIDSQWHPRDVTDDSNAPSAAPGSALAFAKDSDGETRVYYLTSDSWWSGNQHICELASKTKADSWSFRDVTKASNAPPAAPGSVLTSANRNGEIRVYYLTNDQHIVELELASKADSWSFRDVMEASNAPPAAPGSALASANDSNGEMRVYYLTGDCRLSENQRIVELVSKTKPDNSYSWAFRDVTKDSNAPPAAPGSALASAKYSDGEMRVYYLVDWNHIYELASKADSWSFRDVTKDSNAPPGAPGSMLTSANYNGGEILVYYLTDDQCIVELASKSDRSWSFLDVTKDRSAPPAAAGSTLKVVDYTYSSKGPK